MVVSLPSSLVDRVYSIGKYVPETVTRAAICGLNGIASLEIAARRNTIPLTIDRRRIEFVYTDAASMVYFGLSIGEETISHEVPYRMLDLPSRYDLAIDVGAHFGVYSVLLGSLNDLELVSIEPSDRNRRVLGMNLIHNGITATVDDRVVTGSPGRVTFYEGTSVASNDHTTRPTDDSACTATPKETVTVSSIIESSSAVDAVFVKIDAEGNEAEIIEDLLSCDVETVSGLVELHPDRLEGGGNGVLERLADAGFRVEAVPSIGNPIYRFTNDVRELPQRDDAVSLTER